MDAPRTLADTETAWARTFHAAIGARSAGAYINFMDRDDDARLPDAFTPTAWDRLADLQRRYDPDHVFQPRRSGAACF